MIRENVMTIETGSWSKLRSYVLAAVAATCVGLLDTATRQTAQAADIAQTPAEQFKAFLSSPPVVESIVFQIINYDMALAQVYTFCIFTTPEQF